MFKRAHYLIMFLLLAACSSVEPDVKPAVFKQTCNLLPSKALVLESDEISASELRVLDRELPCCYDPILDPLHKRVTKKVDIDGDGYASRWEINMAWDNYYEKIEKDALFTRRDFQLLQAIVAQHPITVDSPLTKQETVVSMIRDNSPTLTYKEWSQHFDQNQDDTIDLDEYQSAKAYYDSTYNLRD